jgi:hypothetical protein
MCANDRVTVFPSAVPALKAPEKENRKIKINPKNSNLFFSINYLLLMEF